MQSDERLDKTRLLSFLEIVSKELVSNLVLVAAGGTAMTLLGLKPSTIDVDFTAPASDLHEFRNALRSIPHGFKRDSWEDGAIFSQILPADYLNRSVPIEKIGKIELRALHPIDIVVTKIGRLDERDKQDIEVCIRKYKLTNKQVTKRANQVEYVGRGQNYHINLQHVLKQFFPG
ncbi:MAG: DUF6036 family nucleotidyltransferase [Nitrososphaerales archaeon]